MIINFNNYKHRSPDLSTLGMKYTSLAQSFCYLTCSSTTWGRDKSVLQCLHYSSIPNFKVGQAKARAFSSTSEVSPIKIYPNADTQKILILKENKGSSGVYR